MTSSATSVTPTVNLDIATIIPQLGTLKASSLKFLEKAVQEQYQRKIQGIEELYGQWFCNIIGRETIEGLPVVKAEQLGVTKHLTSNQIVEYMRGNAAVRGVTGLGQAFIAITFDVMNAERQSLAKVVEVICQQTSYQKSSYFPVPYNHSGKEEFFNSQLYTPKFESGSWSNLMIGMSETEIEAVRDLLDGKEIKDPVSGTYWIKKV